MRGKKLNHILLWYITLGTVTNEWTANSKYRRRRRNEFTRHCQCTNGGTQYGSTGASTNTTMIRDAVWVASLSTLSHDPGNATTYSHKVGECFCRTQWSCTHCSCGNRHCATECCRHNGPRRCAVSPRDQGSFSRGIISVPRDVYQAWTNLGKSAGTGEHGRGNETAQQGEVASSAQVQETLRRTASVVSNLEAKLGATSVAQEQSRVTTERAQMTSEKAMRELQMLQLT